MSAIPPASSGSTRSAAVAIAAAVLACFAASASAHPERATYFPEPANGKVPEYRTTGGRQLVVCKDDSAVRIRRSFGAKPRSAARRRGLARNKALLKQCRFEHIQAAVNAARSYDRIVILPGLYKEEPSRAAPHPDPKCAAMFETTEGDNKLPPPLGPRSIDPASRPDYQHQLVCPNDHNLIAIIGDRDRDSGRRCDTLCHLQIEGTGRRPEDVVIEGDRKRADVIRADRVDGFHIRNLTVEQGEFNDLDIVETDGYAIIDLVARYGHAYGVLSFTSDHGLYDGVVAYGSGDSGVYPGSAAERHCHGYSVELRNVESYGNGLGYSGTAGNSVWVHDSKFHDNSTGISTDSFAAGHPGSPQDCARFENNEVYSNNMTIYDAEHDAYCKKYPFEKRKREYVCPNFPIPIGVGIMFFGANSNLVRGNHIYDNWRNGMRQFWVPAVLRGVVNPLLQFDTSNGNRMVGNYMGITPEGKRAPNGVDFFWDEEGQGNCWEGNYAYGGRLITSDPDTLPRCPGTSVPQPSNPLKLALEATCAAWNPHVLDDPPGCAWFTIPPKPQ